MQTPEGAKKARQTLIKKYGSEEAWRQHMADIAVKSQKSWEQNGRKPRGFSHPDSNPWGAGAIGGKRSRRQKAQ